eukprot:CAMPEP_0113586432 /NCGR_PEP_ID=MMETSP0015_2-20120614/34295_1 /TAXON_ID=2838 /ORGANISM="Odontella" /LENGTH=135 /DNA_ID=CAMNT_0000491871 /DNA_START=648 /DNA_END=1055 /DNA_ORIENTATION=+ /assembly_acc=CAM_ASM_000160
MAMDAGGESVPVSFVHFATSRGGDGSRQVEKFERAERTCFRGRKVEGNDELLELVGATAASRWELKVCDKGELGCRGQVEFSPFKPPTGEDVREAGVISGGWHQGAGETTNGQLVKVEMAWRRRAGLLNVLKRQA